MGGLATDWVFHPARTRRVARIARADDLDAAALADALAGYRRLRRRVERTARAVGRAARDHAGDGERIVDLEREVDALPERVHVTGHRPGRAPTSVLVRGASGRPVTVAQAATEIGALTRRLDEESGRDHHGTLTRAARVAGGALLAVDVVALFLVFARLLNLDWADPQAVPLIGASVFSVIGAGTMAKLALQLGERLWVWRRSGAAGVRAAPARGGLVTLLAAALAVLSLGTGLGVMLRILEDAAALELGVLGPVLGVVVGVAGAVAPWLMVVAHAHDGTELTRALAGLTPIVVWTARRLHELERDADGARTRRREQRVRARVRVLRADRLATRARRRHEEVVQRARAAGALGAPVHGEVVDRVVAPLHELLELMDRCP